jgi:hypothetical protein
MRRTIKKNTLQAFGDVSGSWLVSAQVDHARNCRGTAGQGALESAGTVRYRSTTAGDGGRVGTAPGRLGGVRVPNPDPDRAPEGSSAPSGGRWSKWRSGAALDWLFRNRQTGGITIAQLPNVPLWIFLATVVLRWFIPPGTWVRTAINWIAVVALGWWALDELLRGVNPWRRALGLGFGGLVVVSAVSLVH